LKLKVPVVDEDPRRRHQGDLSAPKQ
jgi:hypothetical protein